MKKSTINKQTMMLMQVEYVLRVNNYKSIYKVSVFNTQGPWSLSSALS